MFRTCTDDFVGFKDEEKAIIDQLTSALIERNIVSIVGMPGSGKTTLAKKVYDSPLLQNHFHKRAWCSISQFYKKRELFSTILKAVGTSVGEIQEKSDGDLEHLLYKSLKEQRYLIVLDDIWDVDAWEALQRSFPDDRNGSKIMLTSRINSVALHVDPDSPPHFLRLFSNEECWELLRKKLFHADDCPPNLLGIGMQIAKKCKGLPLAVVVIAGLLAKEVKNLGWWRQIEESLRTNYIAGTSCMDILELSYNHLPDFLKPCLLYFGAFQEDKEIDAKSLTLLWIAEGFILNPGRKSLLEVAKEYLMDLINRNLVLVSRKSSICGFKGYYVHDLILELCLRKAKEENIMELVREDDIKAKLVGTQSNPTRYDKYRLSIHADPSSFIDSSATRPCVRSIIFPFGFDVHGFSDLINFCNNFKFLEVLHLCFWFGGWRRASFPIQLTLLVHLRYLKLMCRIKSIPPSIANLRNLEIFWVVTQYEFGTKLPNTIWKMRKLRHVQIDAASMASSDDVFEESNQLDDIESFSSIILEHGEDAEKLLRMPRVRKLKFIIFNSWDNQFSILSSLSRLEALSLVYEDTICNEDDPYSVNWEIGPYPYAISFPSSLKKLSLSGLRRPWKEISAIGQLPNLEVLNLSSRAFEGQRWDMEDAEFLSLKCLKLYYMDFRQWNASSDPFPCLQQLYVEACHELEGIPLSFGTIYTLNMIHVHWCGRNVTSSARQIVKEQQELGNKDLEVHIR